MKHGALTIATAAATVGLAIPLAATAHHRPGHTGGDTTARLSIAAEPEPVLWGANATISGRLRGPENAGQTIELQHDPHPYGADYNPDPLARATTNDNGFYSFTVAPARHTNYRVRTTTTDPRQISENFKLHVRMRINRRVGDRTPRRGQRVAFVGAVAPAHDGGVIRIQRRGSDGVFRTVARTRLTDAGEEFPTNSFYERRLRIRRDGTFRVQVKGDADHSGNSTAPVRIDVH